jgi:alpha-beta hydrolase superfamily lysophospholipase
MEQSVYFYNHQEEKLAGTLHLPDEPNGGGVVFGHCFTCSRNTRIIRHICSDLAAAGFIALRFDFSGNGQSEGDFAASSYSKQMAEIQKAVDIIAEKGAEWIGLAGHSMGAVIAILTAARMNRAKAVCALAGRLSGLKATHFFNKRQIKELHDTGRVSCSSRGRPLQLSTAFFADAEQFNLPETLKTLQAPLMIVHGDHDEIVPVEEAHLAQKLNLINTKLAIIPNADHMFSNDEHRLKISKLVVKWFEEQHHGYT